ncbi:MAG: co-chaperone GroES [Brevinematia bacterium]
MKVKPLGNKVLIRVKEMEEKTKGGIFIPQTAQEKTQRGIVEAVGPGKKNEKGELITVDLKVGSEVIYDKYAGTQIKIDDVEYLLVSSEDILAVVEE